MRKQLIFLMTDTTRKDMVGCYGNPKMKTPNLDRLAEEGIRYENAYTCQPVCGPARSAIFTGTFPHTNGMVTNSIAMGDNVKTVGQRLSDNGIACGYIGKWHLDGSDYFGNGRCPDGWDSDYWYDMKTYLNELSDEDKVKSGIVHELKDKYASEEGLVENSTPEEDADVFFECINTPQDNGAVAWSLGTDRLNIYYNPYTIGSWALGLISISLPFEKYPDLVKEEYQAAPADYAVKIAAYADYSADIYNDGTFVDVSVYPYGADGFANNALRIQIQNKEEEVASQDFNDMYYFNLDAYYVRSGDRHFLHVLTHAENDWTTDNVYEITNGQIHDLGYVEGTPALIRYEYNYNENSLFTNSEDVAAYNDPGALYLEKTMNAFSTYSGSRHYHVGSSGLLESRDPYVVGPAEIVVTVKKALTVKKTDASGRENGKTEVIPVGTKLYFYMTDNESYVIFRYDGDQYGKVSMYNSDWPQKINGEELESVLDGVMFAG